MSNDLDPRFSTVASLYLDALSAVDTRDRDNAAKNLLATTERLGEIAEDDPSAVVMGAYSLMHGMIQMMARKWGIDRLDVISHIRTLYETPDDFPDS